MGSFGREGVVILFLAGLILTEGIEVQVLPERDLC